LFNFKVSGNTTPAPANSTHVITRDVSNQRRSYPEVKYNQQTYHQQFHSNVRRESYPENTYSQQRIQPNHQQTSYNSSVNTFQQMGYNPHVGGDYSNNPSFQTFDDDLSFLNNILH